MIKATLRLLLQLSHKPLLSSRSPSGQTEQSTPALLPLHSRVTLPATEPTHGVRSAVSERAAMH